MFFAHKVWFNLRASLVNKEDGAQIEKIFKLTTTIELMVERSPEILYLADSLRLVKLISKAEMTDLLENDLLHLIQMHKPDLKDSQLKDDATSKALLKLKSDLFAHLAQNKDGSVDEEKKDNELPYASIRSMLSTMGIKLKPYVSIFWTPDSVDNSDRDLKIRAFLSTPGFINDLADISVKIIRSTNKKKYLKKQLDKINERLPATCYVPVLRKDQRNYMVLSIASSESRLFITAEKAPFLINLEVFQPQELELHIQQEINETRPRAFEILKQLNILNKDSSQLLKSINL